MITRRGPCTPINDFYSTLQQCWHVAPATGNCNGTLAANSIEYEG